MMQDDRVRLAKLVIRTCEVDRGDGRLYAERLCIHEAPKLAEAVLALAERVRVLEEALAEAVEMTEGLAEDKQYGYPYTGCDPKDFQPDERSCHPEEIAAHKAALEAGATLEAGYRCVIEKGRVVASITESAWGIGIVTWHDADMAARVTRWKQALAGAQPALLERSRRKALVRLLLRIGSWSDARWDQHLRSDVGDERADAIIAAVQRFLDDDVGVPRRYDAQEQRDGTQTQA